MHNKIKEKLFAGFDIEEHPFIYRRLLLTSIFLAISLFAFVAFFFINLSLAKYSLVMMDGFVIISAIISLYLLLIKKKVKIASIAATCILFVFLLLFVNINKNESFGLVWTLCYPLFVVPILGTRIGVFMIVLFYAILVPMAYLGIGEWDYGNWDYSSFLRFLIASITFAFIAYFYESTSVSAYQSLLETRKKEKTYLSELTKLSMTDQLTGLHNRRYFDEQFQLEYQKFLRSSHKFCLIMVDIDYFKSINDEYGHQVGDNVLKGFSRLLKSRLRTTDTLSRWGGEEFIIMLPETSISNGAIIAEKMRVAISENEFEIVGKLTASLGVAEVNTDVESNKEAIINVDNALYEAKRNGRNRVVVYEN